MNILMMTNTYTPFVGGVPLSIAAFSAAYRSRGHRVLVIAPEFDKAPAHEHDVLRIPAIQHFNGSDFSVVLPIPRVLDKELASFKPDIVHSHHPFLLGSTAIRVARVRQIPLVFTHHTLYEHYTHYVPGDSPAMQRFAIDLSTHYANLCDQVFAPSQSIAAILTARGVTSPIAVVPTGVDTTRFRTGNGQRCRRQLNIPSDAFVVGHLGRLAEEKNLRFLTKAVIGFLQRTPAAYFFVAGVGPLEPVIRELCIQNGVEDRLRIAAILDAQAVADAYCAMSVFAFASQSETQGMVLTEAMAAGVPIVALDGPGVREVIIDQVNGRLLMESTQERFIAALNDIANASAAQYKAWVDAAKQQANAYSIDRTSEQALQHYADLIEQESTSRVKNDNPWLSTLRLIEAEWSVLKGVASAAGSAIIEAVDEHKKNP